MKKNGFTLSELIITVGLIALLSTVVLINMTSVFGKQTDEKYEKDKNEIKEAAKSYVDFIKSAKDSSTRICNNCANDDRLTLMKNCTSSNKDNCHISYTLLLEQGLLSEDNNKIIKYLIDKKSINNCDVNVFWEKDGDVYVKQAELKPNCDKVKTDE